MSISSVTNAALNALQRQSLAQRQTSAQDASSSNTGGSSSAYTLSLGQQKAGSELMGYDQLGKMVRSAETSLDSLTTAAPVATATFGDGRAVTRTYAIDVSQLAAPQVVSGVVTAGLAGGTLSVQSGSLDAAGNSFTPSGNPVQIPITDGSPAGVAKAINGANAGVTAEVVDGQLQVTGQSGAANAFSLSGIAALSYDPASASFAGLQADQSAQDAVYSVDGGAPRTSPTNNAAEIASGVHADFAATGATSVTVPLGLASVQGAAQSLAETFNFLQSGLQQVTASGGSLNGDPALSNNLTKALATVAGQSYPGLGSLADVGITVGADGSLNVDAAAVQKAYSDNPDTTRSLLISAAKSFHSLLAGSQGAEGAVSQQMHSFASMLTQMPSLVDILNQSSSGQSSSGSGTSDWFGQNGGTTPQNSANGSSPTQMPSLMSALNPSGSNSSTLSSWSDPTAALPGSAALRQLLDTQA
jgi:flagellar hook-associated protein 2